MLDLLAQAAPTPPPGLTPSQVLGFVLLDIAIILVAARLMGSLAKKVGQPTVVGEIIAGVLLGPSLLGPTIFTWTSSPGFLHCNESMQGGGPTAFGESITSCFFPPQSQGVLSVIGQIALVLFMFLVGLELDWELLRGKGKGIAIVSFGAVAVPIGLAFLVGPVLFDEPSFVGMADPSRAAFTLFVAAMLVVTAFPVMARILQEKGMIATDMGSVGVAAAAVVTVLMFLTVAVASGVAGGQGASDHVEKFLIAGAYIAVLFLLVRPALAPLGRAYERAGALTPTLFAVVLVLLFASAYAAHQIGINVIVGGFLAGAVLPARQGMFRDMAARLSDFTAIILLPIFLAFSGLRTDFTVLRGEHVVGIVLFVVAAIVGKWLGSAVFARLGGLSWGEGNVLGILMNCRGLLVLVVGLIALTGGVISPALQVAGVVMALVTTMMTGPLFDAFAPRVAPPPEAEIPERVGGKRVLAGLSRVEDGPVVARAAFDLIGDERPAEVILCRPVKLSDYDTLPVGIGDQLLEIDEANRAARMVAGYAPEGVECWPLVFSSSDPVADLARVAEERDAEVLVVAADGFDVEALADLAPCDVMAVPSSGEGTLTAVGEGARESSGDT